MESNAKQFVANFDEDEKIFIKDPESVKAKIQKMKGCISELKIFADFDFTLTKKKNGETYCDSCIGVIERSPFLDPGIREQCMTNFKKYYNVSYDLSITEEERSQLQTEWTEITFSLFKEAKLSKHFLEDSFMKSSIIGRYGLPEFLELCHKSKIPLNIVSGGIKSVITKIIDYVMEEANASYFMENIRILANEDIDPDGSNPTLFMNMKQPLLHTVNKAQLFSNDDSAQHGIILGDLVDDLKMIENVTIPNLLKIGFLNNPNKNEEIMDQYVDAFDIVISNDGNLIHVVQILNYIAGNQYEKLKEYNSLKNSEIIQKLF